MELIEEYKEGEDNTVVYWLSERLKECGIRLKTIVDFNCEDIELIEEDTIGKEHEHIFITFNEFKNLQTIIEERKEKK